MHDTQCVSRSTVHDKTCLQQSTGQSPARRLCISDRFAVRQPSDSEANREVKSGVGIGVRRQCPIFEICASDRLSSLSEPV